MKMNDFSILIGGKAGDGIERSSLIIGRIMNRLGYRIYIYREYPSVIRGGHTSAIIRASRNKIAAHTSRIDMLLALNQDTLNLHKNKLKERFFIIYDSDSVKSEGLGIPLEKIVKEENAPAITQNSCIIGALGKAIGMKYETLEEVFKKNIKRELELNLKIARRGYEEAKELIKIEPLTQPSLPVLTGNEAIGLGLLKSGLRTYISYPMTPASSLLHFLAQMAEKFYLKVIQPEGEIAVMLMAIGLSYAGEKVAVGTSGGGFCLMTEGLGLSAMAELPVVVVIGQRPGPSTGIATYTAQSDLHFALNAGQGEFVRFVVAPSDAEEAYYWSAIALNISWKYQTPSIILVDKTLGEGTYSFDVDSIKELKVEEPVLWDRRQPYKRYLVTETGVSPFVFVPNKDAIVKASGSEHDEFGLSTDNAQNTKLMQEKRLRKEIYLAKDLEKYETVKVYGDSKSSIALLCWGSHKGVCVEIAERYGLKVIQPIVLSPFPIRDFQTAVEGVNKLICVENNATGQLVRLVNQYSFRVDEKILKYDGRPFSLEDLDEKLKPVIV